MAELLLELFSEEIPARMQAKAADDLKRLVEDGLKKAGLEWTKSEAFVTPRRLALVVDGLPEKQPDVREERKGPQVGAPEQAINGFLGSLGGLTLDDCEQREVKGKTFYFAVIEKKGIPTRDVIFSIVSSIVQDFSWPKSMRWGASLKRWVRPLHSVVCIFNNEAIRGYITDSGMGALDLLPDKKSIPEGSVPVGCTTYGHRFLSPGPIAVTNFADYRAKLAEAHVMLCSSERRAEILSQAEALAERAGLTLKPDEGLLQEVTGLVEWPVALMGAIDDEFMELPPEVLTTTMRVNQKYFTLLDVKGQLAPNFITIANQTAPDGGAAIAAGNERVLRARLADAKFFWDSDRKRTLASRTPELKDVVFHAELGTMDEKVDRVQALAAALCAYIPDADRDKVRSAARLAKADLVTGMVYEFPEVQGVMGRYYALNDGEAPEVADAIAEHYSPVGPNDDCPTAPVSVAVALADKLDTLVGFWTIDEKPTGSKDPYALRRAALGVIRLIIENKLRLSLKAVFVQASRLFPDSSLSSDYFEKYSIAEVVERISGQEVTADDVRRYIADDLMGFFADRLKVHLKGEGVRHDLIDAVFALGDEDDLVRLLARVDELAGFVDTDDGANLLIAYKRAANIVRIEEKKDGVEYRDVNRDLFEEEEDTLWQNLHAIQESLGVSLEANLFAESMEALAQLRKPVDNFFDNITVNSDDEKLRANRLALLRAIVVVMNQIADFSKIEG